MKTIITTIIIVAIVVGFSIMMASKIPKCVRGHYEQRHKPQMVMMIYNGTGMIPIVQQGYDYQAFICDERES